MTVRKYRRVEDIPPPGPAATPLAGLASACELARFSEVLGRSRRGPRGVRRFRSVAEADAHRRGWESVEADPGESAVQSVDRF